MFCSCSKVRRQLEALQGNSGRTNRNMSKSRRDKWQKINRKLSKVTESWHKMSELIVIYPKWQKFVNFLSFIMSWFGHVLSIRPLFPCSEVIVMKMSLFTIIYAELRVLLTSLLWLLALGAAHWRSTAWEEWDSEGRLDENWSGICGSKLTFGIKI